MKRPSFNGEHLFIPAIVLSASAHFILITANALLPGSAQFSVNNAPSSLEFTVVSQPIVSVIEEAIVTEQIIDQVPLEQVVFHDPSRNDHPKKHQQSSISSQKSLGAVTNAKPLMHANPAPPYPKIARQRGWEGTVRLNVLVQNNGIPIEVGVYQSSGHHALDSAALKAVEQWKFSPAQSGQLRFSSKIIIPIQFTLIKQK